MVVKTDYITAAKMSRKTRKIEEKIETETKQKTETTFRKLMKILGVANVKLKINFIKVSPAVKEHVFGEAFPEKKLIKLEIFAPDATFNEIKNVIIHELTHIKHPELLGHCDAFWEKVQECKSMVVLKSFSN